MRNQSLNIDATKYDIRILWTGLKEEHRSADAGLVEGYPLDPPDESPGWFLVDFGIETAKDADRYWTLWKREKTAAKRARAKKAQTAPQAPAAPAEPKKRGRKPKPGTPTTVLEGAQGAPPAEPETN